MHLFHSLITTPHYVHFVVSYFTNGFCEWNGNWTNAQKCIVPLLLRDVRKMTLFGGHLVIKVPTIYQLSYLIWFVWLEVSIYYGWSNLQDATHSRTIVLDKSRRLGAFSSTSYIEFSKAKLHFEFYHWKGEDL